MLWAEATEFARESEDLCEGRGKKQDGESLTISSSGDMDPPAHPHCPCTIQTPLGDQSQKPTDRFLCLSAHFPQSQNYSSQGIALITCLTSPQWPNLVPND